MLEDKEKIRSSFNKVKEDMIKLDREVSEAKFYLNDLRNQIVNLSDIVLSLRKEINKINQKILTQNQLKQQRQLTLLNQQKMIKKPLSTDVIFDPTYLGTSTDTSTVPLEIQGLKPPNLPISTGNDGASTDRQTVRQTDKNTKNTRIYTKNQQNTIPLLNNIPQINLSNLKNITTTKSQENHETKKEVVPNESDYAGPVPPLKSITSLKQDLSEAEIILDSLDNIKKDIRRKFKSMTQQEMLVFSTIYQLEEQSKEPVGYGAIASKLNLSQSSIRDYVQRIINKGIPLDKVRINNKKIALSVSNQLKKVATLDTIIKLRDI